MIILWFCWWFIDMRMQVGTMSRSCALTWVIDRLMFWYQNQSRPLSSQVHLSRCSIYLIYEHLFNEIWGYISVQLKQAYFHCVLENNPFLTFYQPNIMLLVIDPYKLFIYTIIKWLFYTNSIFNLLCQVISNEADR